MNKVICGVDVSSQWLDARIGQDGPYERFASDPGGIAALAGFCRQQGVDLVALEATGGYERQPLALLWGEGVAVAIVNPLSVRNFAKSMGRLEKTDRIDAGMIAWYAATKGVRPTPPASATQAELAACTIRLRQLTEAKTVQTNQRRLVKEPGILAGFEAMIGLITRQIHDLEARIATLIDSDPLWQKLDQTFRTIKGVADRTVARLMAEMPEIGTISNKAIAKLAGLAPLARDSGKTTGKRPTRGGRSTVRSILYVVAGVVAKYDPDFKAFHQRLSSAGKPKKVIRIALAHKLLTRLNAKARDARKEFANAT